VSLLQIWVAAFLIGFSGAVTPGPVLGVVVGESPRKGAVTGPLVVTGHMIVEFMLLLSLYFGLSRFIRNPAFPKWIAIGGGVILAWLGVGMSMELIRDRARLRERHDSKGKGYSLLLLGALATVSNPFWYIWWAAFGMAIYVAEAFRFGSLGFATLFSGHILSDFLWYGFVSSTIALGRNFFSDRIYKFLIFFCGLFLVGMGVYFIRSGILGKVVSLG